LALLDSELNRIRYELGYNVVGIGAEPMIGHVAIFDTVIQPYLQAGAKTTSTTSVTAATTPTLVTLTLALITGFTAGDAVVVDVDTRQERATVESVSGSTISLLLSKAHSGTYAVTVEGGESIVREILGKIQGVIVQMEQAASTAGIKRVDDIEFWGENTSTTQLSSLKAVRSMWRDELAGALGVPNMWRIRQGGGSICALY
jgi:hypothetical protein